LIKIAFLGANHHKRGLEPPIMKAKEAGATNDEMKHVLLLLIQMIGFSYLYRSILHLSENKRDLKKSRAS
jgi:alkylhydroperoxidase/carboxymuconolactone decarboxylase family protein YurZ